MSKELLTVVFEFDSGEQFPKDITEAFCKNSKLNGCSVIAVSRENEIARVEEFEERITDGQYRDKLHLEGSS